MPSKTAILIDGGFLTHRLRYLLGKPLEADDIIEYCEKVMKSKELNGSELFRIYYYDCFPYKQIVTNPIDNSKMDYATTEVCIKGEKFLDELALKPKVAFRKGTLLFGGWKIGQGHLPNFREIYNKCKLESETKSKKPEISKGLLDEIKNLPKYITIDLNQKGVDMKIGLDIAWLSSKRIVDNLVLITSDTDFIPAMKFARREGMSVYINSAGLTIKKGLIEHSDGIIAKDE